ncbi:MAG: hypothetical protein IJ730_06320 [Alphaproteobacteria bacterium]|nr:hypothetical protein [Alphaproteobacteria bacterium]
MKKRIAVLSLLCLNNLFASSLPTSSSLLISDSHDSSLTEVLSDDFLTQLKDIPVSHFDIWDRDKLLYLGISDELDKNIEDYVNLEKTDEQLLEQRNSLLLNICRSVKPFLTDQSKKKKAESLFCIAVKKYNYTSYLLKNFGFFDITQKPKDRLRWFIKNYMAKNKTEINMIMPEYFLQAMDPYHIFFSDQSLLFQEWKDSDSHKPFLIWLEGKRVRNYSFEQEDQNLFSGKMSDVMMQCPLEKINEFGIADFSKNSMRRYAVYNIILDRNGIVKFTPFNIWGHVGISDGKPVLFAGEIMFERGIVREISNQSGHFQPSLLYLENFQKLLIEKQLIKSDIRTRKLDFADFDSYSLQVLYPQLPELPTNIADVLVQLLKEGSNSLEYQKYLCVNPDEKKVQFLSDEYIYADWWPLAKLTIDRRFFKNFSSDLFVISNMESLIPFQGEKLFEGICNQLISSPYFGISLFLGRNIKYDALSGSVSLSMSEQIRNIFPYIRNNNFYNIPIESFHNFIINEIDRNQAEWGGMHDVLLTSDNRIKISKNSKEQFTSSLLGIDFTENIVFGGKISFLNKQVYSINNFKAYNNNLDNEIIRQQLNNFQNILIANNALEAPFDFYQVKIGNDFFLEGSLYKYYIEKEKDRPNEINTNVADIIVDYLLERFDRWQPTTVDFELCHTDDSFKIFDRCLEPSYKSLIHFRAVFEKEIRSSRKIISKNRIIISHMFNSIKFKIKELDTVFLQLKNYVNRNRDTIELIFPNIKKEDAGLEKVEYVFSELTSNSFIL